MGRSWNKTRMQQMTAATQRMTQNPPKIPPGRAQDTLNRSRNPPRAPSSEEKPRVTQQMPKKSRKSAQVGRKSPQRDHSGTQAGPQNRPKSSPGPKKWVPAAVFFRFFRRRARKSIFAPMRGQFWEGPTLKMWPDHHTSTELDFQKIMFF